MLADASLDEVQLELLKHSRRLTSESISVLEAVGRVSAEDIYAEQNLPASNQSAVDGYAVAEEGPAESVRFRIIGHLGLGDISPVPLQPGQAARVVTGGELPPGSRAVVPHEKAEIEGDYLRSLETVKIGNNIKQAGEDYVRGNRLLDCGSVITPGSVALLAAFGKTRIAVVRKPRVAVICLSSHVVPWHSLPEPGQIRDSNGPLLSALILQDGGLPVAIKCIGKDRASTTKVAVEVLEQADILIMTGGTYAEDGNEARQLMETLGAEIIYWDVPILPGSHTGASVRNSNLLFSLSGNPGACAVGYHLFAAPVLLAMQGLAINPQRVKATCINGFAKKSGSRRFLRGHANWHEEGWVIEVLPGQKPSMIRSLVECNALLDIPAGSPPVEAGQDVSILLLKPLG